MLCGTGPAKSFCLADIKHPEGGHVLLNGERVERLRGPSAAESPARLMPLTSGHPLDLPDGSTLSCGGRRETPVSAAPRPAADGGTNA